MEENTEQTLSQQVQVLRKQVREARLMAWVAFFFSLALGCALMFAYYQQGRTLGLVIQVQDTIQDVGERVERLEPSRRQQ